MRGHVYKRGGTWTVVYDEHTDDGRRRQRSRGGFQRRKDAETFLADTLARIDGGTYAAPSKLTVADFLEREWLPTIEDRLRPLTVDRYRSAIRLYVRPRVGGQRLQSLTPGALNAMYAGMRADGLSVASRRVVHAVMSGALSEAVRLGYVNRNVARLASPPSREGGRAQAWTASEVRRYLEHVRTDRLFALWRLAATTGMRRGELAGLTWRAVDLESGRLSVEQQLVPTRGGATLGEPKSRRSMRTVALDADTVTALRAHRETQHLERDFAGPAYVDRDLVFADALGGSLHPQRLTELFRRNRKAAGIPVGSLHVLRHTAATLALTAGVPVHIVAARLGDDPKTILGVYAHLLPQSDELAAERIAAAIV